MRRSSKSAKPPKPLVTTRLVAAAEAGISSSKDDITGASTEAERNELVFFSFSLMIFPTLESETASVSPLQRHPPEFRTARASFDSSKHTFSCVELRRREEEGEESVGTSYKAVLEEGTTVVVKQLTRHGGYEERV
ncbi:hypothetical protein ACFX10_002124 [Malus domestica]